MDSLSQIALGAALGVSVMGRRTALWKAAAWGGVAGTLPDLDALVDHGDPISNMTLHRADSHALLWLTLAAPPLGWLIARLNGQPHEWRRWCLAIWLILVTHALLDAMTIYGTQLLRPFTDHPYGVGSIFIVDPLYTVPLLVGLAVALGRSGHRGLRWNTAGLLLSTAYLAWSWGAQQHMRGIAVQALADQGITAQRLLVTPTPLNTVLWRVVAVTPDGFHEGFRSLLDREPGIRFDRFDRGTALRDPVAELRSVRRLAWFSHGFYKLSQRGDRVLVIDLRMGRQPSYAFEFAVARRSGERLVPLDVPEIAESLMVDGGRRWLLRRALGEAVAPPR
jgi:inner membrane protein